MEPLPTPPPQPLTWKERINLFIEKYPYQSLFLGVVLFLLTIFIFQRIFIEGQIAFLTMQQERNKQYEKQKEKETYQQLVEKQKKQGKQRAVIQQEIKKQATSAYTLHIIFVKPQEVSEASIHPLISALTNEKTTIFSPCVGCEKQVSLAYIAPFMTSQAKRYTKTNFSLTVKTYGPYTLESIQSVGDIAYIWGKDPFGIVKLEDTFAAIAKEHSIPQKDSDLTMYVYFDDSFNKGVEANERFYQHKKFRSFANDKTGIAYINIYNFSPVFSKTATEIITHEMLHLFGASDKYEEYDRKRECSLSGRGDLQKSPLLPQTTGDIMCMSIEKNETTFIPATMIDETVVINQKTAQEIGWIKKN